jgi:hypothetical protein
MMDNNVIRVLALIFLGLLSGCSVLPVNWGRLSGDIWCNTRHAYLATLDPSKDPAFRKKLALSKAGYMYSVAAVLSLQKDDDDPRFNFSVPDRLTRVNALTEDYLNGFQAETYLLHETGTGKAIEAIIAFRGSDQFVDYLFHNLFIWPFQFTSARDYVRKVHAHPETRGLPIVVTGYSLGGGLAAHVTQHKETRDLIRSAWAFNPSPRVQASGPWPDPRIYLLSTSYEILRAFNRDRIGAPDSQRDETFDLVRSSSIYSHYRWVLARQILKYADVAIYFDGEASEPTEPMRILGTQGDIPGCRPVRS